MDGILFRFVSFRWIAFAIESYQLGFVCSQIAVQCSAGQCRASQYYHSTQ
jgi:hypothetical protein